MPDIDYGRHKHYHWLDPDDDTPRYGLHADFVQALNRVYELEPKGFDMKNKLMDSLYVKTGKRFNCDAPGH